MFKINKKIIEKQIEELLQDKIKKSKNLKINLQNGDKIEKEINASIKSLQQTIKDSTI